MGSLQTYICLSVLQGCLNCLWSRLFHKLGISMHCPKCLCISSFISFARMPSGGCQVGTFLHRCFVELGSQNLQKAQQWCLPSQTHVPQHSWVRTHINTRDNSRYISSITERLPHSNHDQSNRFLQLYYELYSPFAGGFKYAIFSHSYAPLNKVALGMASSAIPIHAGGHLLLYPFMQATLGIPKSRRCKVCRSIPAYYLPENLETMRK